MKRNSSTLTASSRAMRRSTSGMQRVLHSSRYTGSVAGFHSRKGSRMLSDSKTGRSLAQRKAIRVLDEDGNDVTPRPLYEAEPKDPHAKPQRSFFDDYYSRWDTSKSSSFSIVPSSGSRWNSSLPSISTRASLVSQSGVGFSMLDTSQPLGCYSLTIRWDGKRNNIVTCFPPFPETARQVVSQQTPEEIPLDEVLSIYMTETDTIILLDLPSTCMSEEAENAQATKESNTLYIELCNNRLGNDKYVERAMQTFVGAAKHKKVQSEKIVMHDQGTIATIWEIYDSFQNEAPKAEKANAVESMVDISKDPKRLGSFSSISTVGTASTGSSLFKMQGGDMSDEPELQVIFKSETFQRNLLIMERCLVANVFQPKLAAYRSLPEIKELPAETKPDSEKLTKEDEEEDDEEEEADEMGNEEPELKEEEQVITDEEQVEKEEKEEVEKEEEEKEEEEEPDPSLELLWTFSCQLTKGWSITCMAWNKQNVDLLAVGYGNFSPGSKGLICCWSIKNLSWPERLYHCHSGITALDFSSNNPDKLAVGMHDGTVAIFSVSDRESRTFLASSIDCRRRHVHPVWHVTWVRQEMSLSEEDVVESVMSVSEDGHVLKWLLCSHGLEGVGMLELRRIQDGIKKGEGNKTKREGILVSTATPGLCLDFHPSDPTIYLAGTSEGVIHKCSVSNHHHYLALYQKHLCPVNQVQWSPFSHDVFLSGSADWTVQLWKEGCLTPVMGFTSIQSPVLSAGWSPLWPSVFAAIKSEQLEIWDLNASLLDPVIVEPAARGLNLTSMLFARDSNCILVGDSSGQVKFYRILNLSVGPDKTVPSLEEIIHFPTSTS
ncbi:dynein axonemal intermediate chain 4 isoform X1 [Hippocampus zosterae]|uniref:dynein axonemal intermediate chain 4 isoform X1 n=1 Tax=Hippocampus zosterae TaxID=109293 RepID=UPI00223D90B6|nr:dynein axonemal intermediate chain 4 isoform X1 [Hippocampus zosterae]